MFELKPKAAETDSLLQERIRERLEALRRNPREVSLSAGLGPDALRTILHGRSKSPRSDTLLAISKELQCDINYLLGVTNKIWPSESIEKRDNGLLTGVRKLEISNNLSEKWQDITSDISSSEEDKCYVVFNSDIFGIPEFLPGYQHLEYVVDGHASSVAPRGSYVHCVAFFDHNLALKDNDLVILERQRISEGNNSINIAENQRTIRRLRIFGDNLVLQLPNPSSLADSEVVLPNYLPSGEPQIFKSREEALSIPSRVLRSINVISGPTIVRSATPDA
ncbi:helix-turn-helix domain-containing protein [Caulobacter sp. 602-1]|uniref:helix-turn-helix domain-containing protein n=1 Tax=Caulobacter sp. 602-1 TaxID=2492472 RepID=UPI000F6325C8|nr:helix-turn-helix transcriptional regulator [Caulobacter sp. 602-1]RRN64669.1 XRE family transcriptional regulator [Caulobacter sp. 602-1]